MAYMVKYMFRESLPLAKKAFAGSAKDKSLFKKILLVARAAQGKGPGIIGITMGPDLDPEALGAQARHEVWMRYEKFENFQKIPFS